MLALMLGGLLFLAYLLTFSGAPKTDDERFIIDTVDSMALRGNLLLNETGYLSRVRTTDVEPAQPALSVPLYWAAYHIPWMGNVHALFLFSPIVTVLTAFLLFYYALDLGYRERTAVVAVLLFGLSTIVWPYTQTYFREPLTMLSLFGAAFLWNHWRQAFIDKKRKHWITLGLAVIVTLLSLLSKEAVLIALPVLFLTAYPVARFDEKSRRQFTGILIGLGVIAILFIGALIILRTQFLAIVSRYRILTRFEAIIKHRSYILEGMAGFLISPGKAIWWYSPILLLALGAPAALPRSRWRESWLILGLVLLFAFTYAAVRGMVWFGGTGWGARYMVPLVPFLMVSVLPLLDRFLNGGLWWQKAILVVLALWGVVIQIGGLYVNLLDYDHFLEANTGQPVWIGQGIWNFRWSQAIGSLLYLPQARPDILWLIDRVNWQVITTLSVGLILLAVGLVWMIRSRTMSTLQCRLAFVGIPSLSLLAAVFVLWQAYDDPRFLASDETLKAIVAYLDEQTGPDDVVLVSSVKFVPYFMNYYKSDATWYSMPYAPGENYDQDDDPAVASDDIDVLVGEDVRDIVGMFRHGGTYYDSQIIWLVEDVTPWLDWAIRPVEWYLTLETHFVEATDVSNVGRVVKFLPLKSAAGKVPNRHEVEVLFGDSMLLAGFDLVTDRQVEDFETLHPGDMLGVSLSWYTEAPISEDYTVSVHLLGPDGQSILQQDRQPAAGFAPTSSWIVGDPYRDNYGFILPDDLPPGEYQIIVVVYLWPSLERLPVSGPEGEEWGDTLFLTTVTVE